jgi:hypothetical protein
LRREVPGTREPRRRRRNGDDTSNTTLPGHNDLRYETVCRVGAGRR